mgnify:CR=1 FL=1
MSDFGFYEDAEENQSEKEVEGRYLMYSVLLEPSPVYATPKVSTLSFIRSITSTSEC